MSHVYASGDSYSFDQFKKELSSPFTQEEARPYLYSGLGLTSLLIIFRDGVVEPLQDQISEDEPLGDSAKYGDYLGQCIPNALYMGGMYLHGKWSNSTASLDRSTLMLKTSFYAGMATTVLKRIVNQKRPHGADKLSFPSGHTTTAFAFASVVAMEHEWYWGAGAYALASFVGYSRMNDNEHYLHDVVMGATIGTVFGVALHHQAKQTKENSNLSFQAIPLDDQGVYLGLKYRFH